MRNVSVNAGRGSYHLAKKAEELIIATRSKVARLAAVPDIGQVVFAPSATIAANEILNGIDRYITHHIFHCFIYFFGFWIRCCCIVQIDHVVSPHFFLYIMPDIAFSNLFLALF